MNRTIAVLTATLGLVVIYAVMGQERPGAGEAGGPNTVHNHFYYGGGGVPAYGYDGSGRGLSGGGATGLGNLRVSSAESAQIYAQTAGQMTENHNYAVQSYYGNRDEHDKYVAAHTQGPPSAEQLSQITKRADPGRLSTAQFDRDTNVINWPALLRESDFTQERQSLDHLFHERTASNSGADSDNYVEINKSCEAMLQTLGGKLRKEDLPAVTFISAEHFIKSVDYEGTFAAQ